MFTRAGTIYLVTPLEPRRVSSQQPEPTEMRQRVRQAWDLYQDADRTRPEASATVTAELAAAREAGYSMYRMAKWLEVTQRTIQLRLEKHDQANPPGEDPAT